MVLVVLALYVGINFEAFPLLSVVHTSAELVQVSVRDVSAAVRRPAAVWQGMVLDTQGYHGRARKKNFVVRRNINRTEETDVKAALTASAGVRCLACRASCAVAQTRSSAT